ncbi:hypothetical protein Krac_6619 [Ktedonobacter racemifer DSM 44963]|uniref:Transposase n=1 Tax=Ktedonobacter racemifer DSM 44963 TaxID=485913 RepID=D6TVJ7_KTERA|nr:hypothetical protein Krac_6619 [Ktedonobacter racemifer DSM 44963]
MERAPTVGRAFFPLDEELALLPGTLAPRQQSHLFQLGSWMPFRHASRMLRELLAVHVSPETARRLCEDVGHQVEEQQTAEAHQPWKEEDDGRENDSCLVISADGAMVPLTGGEWAEVRTLAIGEVPTGPTSPEKVHVGELSYFSRLTDAAHFTELAEVETRRRHVIQAKAVGAVMDGAEWLQTLVDIHRGDAVRILDFPHAAEHLSQLVEGLGAGGRTFPEHMLERCLHVLKHRGPSPLLRMAERLPKDEAQQGTVREHLEYLRKRQALMQYPTFQQAGWPIGSGMVESANKVVVEARLKGTGMRWKRANVNPMLALRNGVCNQRWLETWQTASQQRRRRLSQHRQRTTQRQEVASVLPNPTRLTPAPVPPYVPLLPPEPPAMIAGTSRPSSHHPWKRSPACRPKPFAKT